jgi:hypothetical protein
MGDPRYTINRFLYDTMFNGRRILAELVQLRVGGGTSTFVAPIEQIAKAGIDLYVGERVLFVVDPATRTGPYWTMGVFKSPTLTMWREAKHTACR